MDGEDWNRPEHDIPEITGKVLDAANSDIPYKRKRPPKEPFLNEAI
jgi:hypothetical protein